jgi:hypothetical protein
MATEFTILGNGELQVLPYLLQSASFSMILHKTNA